MLVYEFDPDQDYSDGQKSLHASQYFGRFAQRLIAAMSAPTAQGTIYELDFRLRPNGAHGPIATSLRAFEKYYAENAWTWERLALTRARVLGKETKFTSKLQRALIQTNTAQGDTKKALKEVKDMRSLMDKERPTSGPWDIKLSKGGLVDLEFIAQSAVMIGATKPGRTTGDILAALGSMESDDEAVSLQAQHSDFQGIAQILRLCLDKDVPPEEGPLGMQEILLRQMELPDMDSAEAALNEAQRGVRKRFLALLKQWSA